MNGEDIFEALGEAEDRFVSAPPVRKERAKIGGLRRRAAIAAVIAAAILLLAGSVFAATSLGAKLIEQKHNSDGTDSFTYQAKLEKTPIESIGWQLDVVASMRKQFYGESNAVFRASSLKSALSIVGKDIIKPVDMGYEEGEAVVSAISGEQGITSVYVEANYRGTGYVKFSTGYIVFTEYSPVDIYTETVEGETGKGQGASWYDYTARGLKCLVVEDAPRDNGRTGMKCVVVSGGVVYELNLSYFMRYRNEALDLMAMWLRQL